MRVIKLMNDYFCSYINKSVSCKEPGVVCRAYQGKEFTPFTTPKRECALSKTEERSSVVTFKLLVLVL